MIRVLLIEPIESHRSLIETYLSGSRFQLISVTDGFEAFAVRRERNCDLILMDSHMQSVEALHAVKLIRRWEHKHKATRIPILNVTANGTSEHKTRSENAGCDGLLLKPFSKSQLLATIEMLLMSHPPIDTSANLDS